jgi:diguanylate cyclase (GGDEF)-like protein/PAS domain S-box-containing protein
MNRYHALDRATLTRLLAEAEVALAADGEDSRRVLHDLQLHQIELEIQNRDLRATQAALEAARDQYAELYDFAPVGYLTLDRSGVMRQLNLTTARLLGRERGRLLDRPLSQFLEPGSSAALFAHLRTSFASCACSSSELRLAASTDQRVRDLRIDSRTHPDVDGTRQCLTTLTDITETKRLDDELRESHRELAAVLAAAPVGIGIIHEQTFSSLSPRLLEMLGFSERELLGHQARRVFTDDDGLARLTATVQQRGNAGAVREIETRMQRKDGQCMDVLLRAAPLSASSADTSTVFAALDITDRKSMERTLAESQRLLDLALDGGNVGIYTSQLPDGEVQADARYLAQLGYRPGSLTLDRETWRALVHPDDLPRIDAVSAPLLQGEIDSFGAEFRMRHARGHWVWVLDRGRVIQRDADASSLCLAGTHIDVTRRREAEQSAAWLAQHDELTALLNRRGIWQAIERMHAEAERGNRPYALAMLDLDRFKQINDAYGHPVGDEVLRQVGARLRAGMRQADWIGRWGGEEFIVVLPSTTEVQALETVERLRQQIGAEAFTIEDLLIPVTLSAGLAVFRIGEDSAGEVVARADQALYRAKGSGRDRTVFEGGASGHRAISIAVAVQDALRTAGIYPAYQPIIALADRHFVAEASFARILDPVQGVMTASAFLDVARQLGLMHKIDHLLLQTAMERLPLQGAGAPTRLFVHLSQDLLHQQALMAALGNTLRGRLAASPTRPPGLVLTIDERLVAGESDAQLRAEVTRTAEALAPLLEQGCELAISGVGGRASSFADLSLLPVKFLFIDSALLKLARESSRAKTLITGITQTAKAMGQITIASQLEDEADSANAAALGIDWGQGYLFGQPEIAT